MQRLRFSPPRGTQLLTWARLPLRSRSLQLLLRRCTRLFLLLNTDTAVFCVGNSGNISSRIRN